MAGRSDPEEFGGPVPGPEEIVLLLPDDDDLLDGDGDPGGPAGSARSDGTHGTDDSGRRDNVGIASDEFLFGTADRGPGVTLALTLAGERLRGGARRHPIVTGVAALCALVLAVGVAVYAARPRPSTFDARITTAGYKLNGIDGVASTLTVQNPSSGPVTLDEVAIGGDAGVDIGVGQAAMTLTIPAGGTGEITMRGLLDCRADQPAVPAHALLTGTDGRGLSRTVSADMPGSAAFSAGIDAYRRSICRVPYPLGITTITYGGPEKTEAADGYALQMRLNVSVATVPGMDPTPVRFTTALSNLPGVRAMMSAADAITVEPGKPGRIDVLWAVDDCSRVPAYAGILSVSVMGVDRRGTQIWDYALGDRFSADLTAGIAAFCHSRGSG